MSAIIENEFKYGSETVADKFGINQAKIDRYCEQLSELEGGLIVVTSGSVLTGMAEAPHITDQQVLAGLGSPTVFMAWKNGFKKYDRLAGEVTATDSEMSDPSEGSTFREALRRDVKNGVIPIFNTNDKLNISELAKRHFKGENDGPAAHITVIMGVKRLALMTKYNGLFDDKGKTIAYVPYDPEYHTRLLTMTAARGDVGQGIHAKTRAIITAVQSGAEGRIAGADQEVVRVLANETGTYFEPKPVEWSK